MWLPQFDWLVQSSQLLLLHLSCWLQVAGKAGPEMLAQLLQMLPPEAASETDQQHILARATQPSLTAS